MELVAVVLGAESSADRFAACKQLLDFGFANYALIRPQADGEHRVPVQLGTVDFVDAAPGTPLELLIDKGQMRDIRVEVKLEGQVRAPVSKGQKLGELTVYSGDRILARTNMVAKEGVQQRSWWQIFLSLLKKCCMGK
jgi:D-alanyl-D-alanine carboxypeptidase (penicillin-binding protein 5/6)